MSSTSNVIFRGQKYCCGLKTDRVRLVRLLLSLKRIDLEGDFGGDFAIGDELGDELSVTHQSMKRTYHHILALELLSQEETVISTLKSIIKRPIPLHYRVIFVLYDCFLSPDIVQFVFRSGSKIWKPLILAIIGLYDKCEWPSGKDEILRVRMRMVLLFFMDRCTESQFRFAIDHNLARVTAFPINEYPLNHFALNFDAYFHSFITRRLTLLNPALIDDYMKGMMWSVKLPKTIPLNDDARLHDKELYVLKKRSFFCGWPACKADGRKSGAPYKCGRCKLVRYCCRNHQKKHWRWIHRTQCMIFG